MEKKKRTFISFDWALKHLLREKANHDVLEGFVSVILKKKSIKIHRLLESEGNKENADSKTNRVDLLAEDENGDLLLIEVQGEPEQAYFQRMLFGASKLVTEYIESGENYEHVKRVYSINIMRYIYDLPIYDLRFNTNNANQKNDFINTCQIIENDGCSQIVNRKLVNSKSSGLYPRYVILKVNDFNHWSRVPLDQWLYFLSHTDIPDDADAPGLREAREKLDLMRMSRDERILYDRYLMDRAILRNTVDGARDEGKYEGFKEGVEKGVEQGKLIEKQDIARSLKGRVPIDIIIESTGLTADEIEKL